MTLQTKFILLISLLALAIAGSAAGAFWAFRFLNQELRTPYQSSTSDQKGLRDVKRGVEAQGNILALGAPEPFHEPADAAIDATNVFVPGFRQMMTLPPTAKRPPLPPLSPDAAAKLVRLADDTDRAIAAVESNDWYRKQIGGTWRNIKDRIRALRTLCEMVARASAPEQVIEQSALRRRGMYAAYEIHELIERSEEQILQNSNRALDYTQAIQRQLWYWIGSVTLFGFLLSALSVILLRRWVERPVAALRNAAAHLATGDLSYRVPVAGRDELAMLSAEVNHMAEKVHTMQEERVERERLAAIGGMVRRLVHNVRNPLAGIRGLAEVTRLDMPKGSEPRENLDLIVSTADTFERWLNELLTVTNPATLNLQTCNPGEWLKNVVEAHRPLAQSKGVELVVQLDRAPAEATFDATHLDHALAAIVSNALEASSAGTRVTVECKRNTNPNEWEVSVADQGPGVPKEIVARIFEPNFTTKKRGTGMGLAMAQQVVRAHSGRIRVESDQNGNNQQPGAVFRLILPLRATDRGSVANG